MYPPILLRLNIYVATLFPNQQVTKELPTDGRDIKAPRDRSRCPQSVSNKKV